MIGHERAVAHDQPVECAIFSHQEAVRFQPAAAGTGEEDHVGVRANVDAEESEPVVGQCRAIGDDQLIKGRVAAHEKIAIHEMAGRAGEHVPNGRDSAGHSHDEWRAVRNSCAARDQQAAIELKNAGAVGYQQLVGFYGPRIEPIGAAPQVQLARPGRVGRPKYAAKDDDAVVRRGGKKAQENVRAGKEGCSFVH